MKYYSIILLFCTILTSISLHSQQQEPQEYKRLMLELIPADAIFTASIKCNAIDAKTNLKNLSELSVSEDLITRAAKLLEINESRFMLEMIRNPKSKGIEFPSELMAFGETESNIRYFNVLVPVSDAAVFKTEISSYFGPKFNNSIVAKGQQLAYVHNERIAISWNKQIAVITFLLADQYLDFSTEESRSELRISLESYLDKLYSTDVSESMAQNSQFKTWYDKIRDAGIWIDYKAVMRLNLENSLGSSEMTRMARNIAEIILSSYGEMSLASDISFEKGKIISDTKLFAPEDIISFSKMATSNRANKKMLKYMDGQKTGIYMTMATSPKGVYEGWKKFLAEKAGAYKNSVEDLFGFLEIFIDEKEAFNFLKGDLFYAVNGLKTIEKTNTAYMYDSEKDEYLPVETTNKEQIPLFAAGFSYGKREHILKLIRIVERTGFLKNSKKNLYKLSLPTIDEPIFLKLDKGLLVISNDEQRMLEDKQYRPMPKIHNQFIKKDFQTLQINTEALVDIIVGTNPPDEIKQMLKNIKDGVGDISLHSLRPKNSDTYISQNFELDLKNKDENALKQFFDFLERIYIKTMKGL